MPDCTAYCNVCNFSTKEKELDFGDFKIRQINNGREATDWKQKISHHINPSSIIIKKFNTNEVDAICDLIDELELFFRLYKPGDIILDYVFIENKDNPKRVYRHAILSALSTTRLYKFEKEDVQKFNTLRKNAIKNKSYKNEIFKTPLTYFELGVDKPLVFHARGLSKIVNYIIALESLFLIDSKRFFLKKVFIERIASFLEDNSLRETMKLMYDIRSHIVHGNYLSKKLKKLQNNRVLRDTFEDVVRKALLKLLGCNFSSREDVKRFMEKLYSIPPKAFTIMEKAQERANKHIEHRVKSS